MAEVARWWLCFAPPNFPLSKVEIMMNEVRNTVERFSINQRLTLVLGEFNAKSISWGFRSTHARGEHVTDLATRLDHRLLNTEKDSMCVRWHGESVDDLFWAF